jgi:hypothetical protein
MKHAQFVRTLGLLLVLGLAGSMVGCGLGAGPVPSTVQKEAEKTIRAENRSIYQSKASQNTGVAPKTVAMRRGNPKSGR